MRNRDEVENITFGANILTQRGLGLDGYATSPMPKVKGSSPNFLVNNNFIFQKIFEKKVEK